MGKGQNGCAQLSKNNHFLKNILTAWSKINYNENPTRISKQIIWNDSYAITIGNQIQTAYL